MQELLQWIDEIIAKYQVSEEDVKKLEDIMSMVKEEDLYGEEYAEDTDTEEIA